MTETSTRHIHHTIPLLITSNQYISICTLPHLKLESYRQRTCGGGAGRWCLSTGVCRHGGCSCAPASTGSHPCIQQRPEQEHEIHWHVLTGRPEPALRGWRWGDRPRPRTWWGPCANKCTVNETVRHFVLPQLLMYRNLKAPQFYLLKAPLTPSAVSVETHWHVLWSRYSPMEGDNNMKHRFEK